MRIGINIPNELYRRLEPLKGRYNISQVCRAALQELVDYHESALMRVEWDGLADIADRYSLFDEVIVIDWGELGLLDAKEWMDRAEPRHFDHLMQTQKLLQRQNRPPWDFMPPPVNDVKHFRLRYGEEEARLRERFGEDLYEREDFAREFHIWSAERKYMEAWLEYVLAAREAIRQRNQGEGTFDVTHTA